MTYSEITKEAFNALASGELVEGEIENLEHARKFHYQAHGCNLMAVNNFLSNVTQYYIQDINA